jgi:hypothetical protein
MTPKMMNFWTTSWFISILICLIVEGSYFGSTENGIISNLSLFTTFSVGDLFNIPVFNPNFIKGLWQLFSWDYSFYTGTWAILRWFWMVVLTPGAIWGLGTVFIYLWQSLVSLFRLVPI